MVSRPKLVLRLVGEVGAARGAGVDDQLAFLLQGQGHARGVEGGDVGALAAHRADGDGGLHHAAGAG